MNTEMNPQVNPPVHAQSPQPAQLTAGRAPDGRIIAGVVLIVFGLLALLATFTTSSIFGLSILPTLGMLFIVWGLVARLPGVVIPGGILTGLGLGTLVAQIAFSTASGQAQGGIIVLGLGLGFLAIMPLILIVSPERHWWALIPGGILTFVGIALIIGGAALDVLAVLGRLWPIAPIVVGIILIWQIFRKREA
jgi:hypothetical protein